VTGPVLLDGGAASIADVVAVARHDRPVEIGPAARAAMAASRARVEQLAASEIPAYGISTGFGSLANRHIPVEHRLALQRSLVRSHAAGMGEPVEREVVRAMMMLRLRTLCTGHTGVRPELADALAGLLNAGITPVVREHGSLGCSGDLAPLAHVALVLTGEGEATGPDGSTGPVPALLAAAGLEPVELREKEGLALINGTDGMLGMLCLACDDLAELLRAADVAAALSVEALLGTDQVFLPELQALRPHPGQAASAANLLALLAGSAMVASHREGDLRVQDAYSLRCHPQVAGAVRDTLVFAVQTAERELAAAIDNPAVLHDGRVSSSGNFHGAPVGYACDFLAIAAADLGAIAERRTDRHLDRNRSHGLAPFLAEDPGVDSGYMIAHYTQAAMVAENRRLAAPASVDSIPTSAMQEDHVSMGWGAARKLRQVLDNLTRIVAIELATAARAAALRAPLASSAPLAAARAAIDAAAHGPGPDRFLSPELRAVEDLVRSRAITSAVGTELR
jgi:histidine ammonia-lyase